jgi:hypothetical protein
VTDPTKPPHGGTPLDPDITGSVEIAALTVAIHSYLVVQKIGPPIDAAAFGIACGELMQTLNISLNVAALLLRIELDRRGL